MCRKISLLDILRTINQQKKPPKDRRDQINISPILGRNQIDFEAQPSSGLQRAINPSSSSSPSLTGGSDDPDGRNPWRRLEVSSPKGLADTRILFWRLLQKCFVLKGFLVICYFPSGFWYGFVVVEVLETEDSSSWIYVRTIFKSSEKPSNQWVDLFVLLTKQSSFSHNWT